MKEAAGEANLTVVAIILIAVIVAVATPLVKSLMNTSTYRACCTEAGGVWSGGCKAINSDEAIAIQTEYEICQNNAGVSPVQGLKD